MAFPSSILYISSIVVVLVEATTAVAQTRTSSFPAVGAVTSNATVTVANETTVKAGCPAAAASSSSSSAAAKSNSNWYICYLCLKRNTLMIKWCPLNKDECHIACLSSPSRRALQPPGPDGHALVSGTRRPNDNGDRGADDCYVMTLYPDGSWIIVDVVSCQAVAGCHLVCSYGDAIAAHKDDSTGATARRLPPPRVADFERCGDQMGLLSAAVLACSRGTTSNSDGLAGFYPP